MANEPEVISSSEPTIGSNFCTANGFICELVFNYTIVYTYFPTEYIVIVERWNFHTKKIVWRYSSWASLHQSERNTGRWNSRVGRLDCSHQKVQHSPDDSKDKSPSLSQNTTVKCKKRKTYKGKIPRGMVRTPRSNWKGLTIFIVPLCSISFIKDIPSIKLKH